MTWTPEHIETLYLMSKDERKSAHPDKGIQALEEEAINKARNMESYDDEKFNTPHVILELDGNDEIETWDWIQDMLEHAVKMTLAVYENALEQQHKTILELQMKLVASQPLFSRRLLEQQNALMMSALERGVKTCLDCEGKGYDWAYGERNQTPVKVGCSSCKPMRDTIAQVKGSAPVATDNNS